VLNRETCQSWACMLLYMMGCGLLWEREIPFYSMYGLFSFFFFSSPERMNPKESYSSSAEQGYEEFGDHKGPEPHPESAGADLEAKKRLTVTFLLELKQEVPLALFSPYFRDACRKRRTMGLLDKKQTDKLLGFVMRSVLCEPFKVKLPEIVEGVGHPDVWLATDSPLSCRSVFFRVSNVDLPAGRLLRQYLQGKQGTGLLSSCKLVDGVKRPVKMCKLRIVGLDFNVTAQDIQDWFTTHEEVSNMEHIIVTLQSAYGRRGTALVNLPPSLVPILHSLPGRTPGTKFYRVKTNTAKFLWCRRCWSRKPKKDGDCVDCEVKCPRCRGIHSLSDCPEDRGSCLHCESINCSVEECASHIVSHCRKLRDEQVPFNLPPPSPQMMKEAPALRDTLPRRLRDSLPSVPKSIHPKLSYLDAFQSAQPVQHQVPADPTISTLLKLVAELQVTVGSLTQTIATLQHKLSEQESQLAHFTSRMRENHDVIPLTRAEHHMEDDSDDDSRLPLASVPIASLALPDLELQLRDISSVAPYFVAVPAVPLSEGPAGPSRVPVGGKRDVSQTKYDEGPRATPDAKRLKKLK
jgi:hypothetical protein